jgi:hypothetical protein
VCGGVKTDKEKGMKVRIQLSALTRMECTKEIEVPNGTSKHVLDQKVREVYDETDSDEFTEDLEYWERGDCYWEEVK